MGPWPDGSRRFKRPLTLEGAIRYYMFTPTGGHYITDCNGQIMRNSVLSIDSLLAAHIGAVELYPPDLAVSEGL